MMASRAANEYGYINARIRGLKSRFLSVGDYERLLQSATYEDFIRGLGGTYYGPLISSQFSQRAPEPAELGLILSNDFADVSYRLTRTLTGRVRDFTQTYLNMFLADSIKSIIRGLHVDLDRDEILKFLVPTSPEQATEFEQIVDAGSVRKAVDILPYWDVKIALLTRFPAYEEFESTAPLEVAVEEWYLRTVLDALADFPSGEQERILGVLEARVDLRNVLTLIRALALTLESRVVDLSLVRFTRKSQALLEVIRVGANWREVLNRLGTTRYAQLAGRLARIYEETNDLSEVELAIGDYVAKKVMLQLTAFPFHIGTVLGFFNLKYFEIRNIRSIAVGLERGESPENIRRMITIW
ncbi:MAG: V-type ATPase subunit [Candidatus Hermodarchaeota archaeon]